MKSAERASFAPSSDRVVPDRRLAGALHEVSNALTVVLGWLADAREFARTDADGVGGASVGGATARMLQDAIAVAHEHARRAHVVARRAIGAQVDDDEGVRTALAVAEDAILAVSHEAEVRDVELRLVGRSNVQVEAPDAVSRVLINLLLNALSFTPQGSTVHVSLDVFEDQVRFRVRDEGPGVPSELRGGLFSSGESKREGGAGVGLVHCALLAKEHGGALSLLDEDAVPSSDGPSSDGPSSVGPSSVGPSSVGPSSVGPSSVGPSSVVSGLGACFQLLWRTAEAPSQVVPSRVPTVRPPPSQAPMASLTPGASVFASDQFGRDDANEDRRSVPPTVPSLSVPPEPPSVRVSFAGKRLLLLEDDEAVLDMVRFGLTARGADVHVATSAARLQDLLLEGTQYDAALLDLSPLGAGARRTLEELARMAVPVILISGSVAPNILDAEGPQGDAPFASWVHKPFALNELYDALVSLDAR